MNNKTALIPFDYKGSPVSVIVDEKGEPWWLAREICQVLKFADSSRPLRSLDNNDKATVPIQHDSYKHDQVIINEGGLYKLIFKSRIPEAKDFQNWITREVLPSIRKTGAYVAPGASGSIETLQMLKILIDNQIALEQRMDKYEAKQQTVTAVLAPVKEISTRSKISQVVREYAHNNGGDYRATFRSLFTEFKYRYSIDLVQRTRNNGNKTVMDTAEECNCLDDLFALAVKLFVGK
jgi:anti-repressor protein